MPNGTITSTENTFGTVNGALSGTVAGTLTGSVGVPGPVGPTGPQGPEGPPGPPGEGGTWGSIVGTLSNQLDLQGQLDLKAPLASPVFTGDARAVTPTFGDNDTSISTTAFVQAALAGGTAVAKNLEVYVRNQSGSTMPAGSIVYISGATGNRPLVTLAQANNDTNSAQTIGFTKTSIANNGFGYVIVRGDLENIDTSALTEGVQLYLSPTTAGAWTTTKPSAPQHLVYVGIVVRAHPTQGVILVAVQNGYELDELHDVAIASKANNDLLAYDSSTNLWKNKTFSALGLLTSADAASTYYLASNPANYITSASLTGYATESWVTSQGFITSAALSGYAPLASPDLTGNVTITTNSTSPALFIEQSGTGDILTLHDQSADTTFVAIDANGKINTIPSTTTAAGFNVPHATAAPTTPVNGDIWTTTGGMFARINGATQTLAFLNLQNTFGQTNTFTAANNTFGNSTATGTTSLASGATISGSTKTVNIGTGGVAGSTSNITIGSASGGTSTTTVQGTFTSSGATQNIGVSTAASTISLGSGATISGATKIVQIGVGGVAGSTTAINIGSASGGASTTTLRGTTNGVTVAADTNTTDLATTAFVVGQASSTAPSNDASTASVGTSLRYARADHVHLNPLPTGGSANQVLSKVDGANYNVQWVTPSGGGGGTDYQAFETAGTFTWTKPAGAKWVEVMMWGGGGGGGSGARQATSSGRSGGSGGSGGGYAILRFPASNLGATQTVVVGAGGAGGASVTVDSTNGNNGSVGGDSTFFGYRAIGGSPGLAGNTTGSVSGGSGRVGFNNAQTLGNQGSTGGQGATGAGGAGTSMATTAANFATSGAGGGAGASAASTTAAAGGAGGQKNAAGTTYSGQISATAGGTGGTTAGVAPTVGVSFTSSCTGSTGSGGGAYITGVAGMAGATGTAIGGAGGGGSASDNGFASGAGGNGASGAVYIITYC